MAAAVAVAVVPGVARAWSWESDDSSLELGGDLRTLPVAIHHLESPVAGEVSRPDGLSQSLLRLTLKGRVGSWLSGEVHAVQGFKFSTTPLTPLGFVDVFSRQRYQALDLSHAWASSDRAEAAVGVDRLNAQISFSPISITVGRQVINFSKAYFWSPLDVFLPLDPRTIDREYKLGVDAVRTDIALGESSGVNLVHAFGPELHLDPATLQATAEGSFASVSPRGSALLARFFTNVASWDISVQAGRVYSGFQLGVGLAGELFAVGARAEATYFVSPWSEETVLPRPSGELTPVELLPDHARVVLGLERRFENGFYITAEYFYNGAAADDDLLASAARVRFGETTNLSSHLLGALVTYEISPTLNGSLAGVVSLSDASTVVTPALSWSAAENVDVSIGALLSFGERPAAGGIYPEPRSEFGSAPNVYYGQLKCYF